MSVFADVKSRKFVKFLKWLAKNKPITLSDGGRHNYKVTCIYSGNSYPIPSSHRIMNKYIVKDFTEWLIKNQICREEEIVTRL